MKLTELFAKDTFNIERKGRFLYRQRLLPRKTPRMCHHGGGYLPSERKGGRRLPGCDFKESSAEERQLFADCLAEIEGKLSYKVCGDRFPVKKEGTSLDFGFTKVDSAGLAKNLEGCGEIILFAATIGLEIDRAIRRYTRLSPAKALFFQAIGAERIESLCDAFCEERREELQAEGKFLKPRFSPGYGDLPLEM